jgi:hypothetical protein
MMRELLVLTYDPDKPSFRYGWRVHVDTLPARQYGLRLMRRADALRAGSAVLLHKLRLHPLEMLWVAARNRKTVFDIDDATWLSQGNPGGPPKRSASRQRAFGAMCRESALTLAGSAFLAERARAAGARVQLVPTAVDAGALSACDFAARQGTTAVWIGLPGNLQYLEPLRPVMAGLAARVPGFRLRIVSSQFPDWQDVPMQRVTWRPGVETEALSDADVGLMPLPDDEFTRGKCAFKLLQYMAASLPCIASPVGANVDVVVEGRTGFLAGAPPEWGRAFETLLADRALRDRLGAAGRERVLQAYDSRIVVPRAATLIEQLVSAPTLTT